MFPGAAIHRVFGIDYGFHGGRRTAGGGGFISVFQEFLASIGKIFILVGGLCAGWAIIMWNLDTFLIFS